MNAARQVRIVLVSARRQGVPFDSAWYRALRQILPPEDCAPELRADHADNKAILAEAKPHFRAAYEGRKPTDAELKRSMTLAERRLADLVERLAA